MKKVLFAAAESVPFAKTGGLADVIGSLPKALQKEGWDVRIIMPRYGDIAEPFRRQMQTLATLTVQVGWRNQYCGVQTLVYEGLTFYFLDNEYYFKRPGLYGYYDDGERFAYFSRAVLEALPVIGFQPDIIHCHDWHAAMIPVLLTAQYRQRKQYRRMKTVFTVHNLHYQGHFPYEVLGDLFGLGHEHFTNETLEFYGMVNFLKGGLVYSDRLTTVSRSYAAEIQTPFYGEKLEGLLQKRSHELAGIVNGIDYELYNPASDSALFARYDRQSPEKKLFNKTRLQAMLGLQVSESVPMLAVVSRLVKAKGIDLIARVLEEILSRDVQLVILGTGEEKYEGLFRVAAHRHPGQVSANIFFDETLARRIYAASDIFLMPSLFEPCGIGQLIAMRYGSLPLVRETGGLRDTVLSYNEATGEGNGFSFTNYNAHDMLHTMERAVRMYQDRPLWHHLAAQSMSRDYSWQSAARQYVTLYQSL
ncbi:glycogen synthase GlgA [Acetonema longum]|uniref:Glycogen synthase n=1 Tax=Acetonema longum DSM 6540 TaxID=1009370 RepID=F7NQE7_9FIRM|nr:glycogen synthase GlgA [Acetonema longum]EGO61725.1 glycogen/starch synthase, ADP-glucose type [Acetonema longum DSM 6540]